MVLQGLWPLVLQGLWPMVLQGLWQMVSQGLWPMPVNQKLVKQKLVATNRCNAKKAHRGQCRSLMHD